MAATILVVEHEPRYADRMKEALSGHPVELHFARDGEETLQFVEQNHPSLIVLSSVIPRISTADLIRQIKSRPAGESTPILITVSGYSGKNPKADAMRLGAHDIIPKPFTDSLFAEKVQQLLDVHSGPKLTSDEIFGDLLSDEKPPATVAKPHRRPTEDVEKLLEQTLSGVRTSSAARKKTEAEAAAAATAPKPRTGSGIDRLVEDTLSGLEKSVRPKTHAGKQPIPVSTPVAPPEPPAPSPQIEEKVLSSSPVFPTVTQQPLKEEPVYEPGSRFGQYLLVERIARGGMAEIWKARMRGVEGFEKMVAIKRILPHLSEDADFVNMFIDEAKLAAQLNHNNIIHIYDLGKIGDSYYIAMEYVEGHDLKDILKRAQERDLRMPIELALFVSSKIAAALDYAHRKRDFEQHELGIVHRDVSPQNVLISTEGDIKLCDFGIAKATSKVSHTQAGALKGKLQYMSPEQAWGRPIDRRSDIFALATVLFEMLTARRLFSADNEISLLDQVREARAEPPSQHSEEVTPEIDAIVLKALQRDPEGRYQTAADMARDLDAILYSFRPTPTSADLAIYLDRLYAPEEQPVLAALEPETPPPVSKPMPPPAPPAVMISPEPGPVRHPLAVASRPTAESLMFGAAAQPKKRRLAIPIAAALVLIAAAGVIGGILMTGRREAAPSSSTSLAQQTPVPAPADTSLQEATAPATELVPVTDTAAEQALIDEEVRRRLAAERTRLDQQRARELDQERARQLELERRRSDAAARVETEASVPQQRVEPPETTATATTTAAVPTATVAESRPSPAPAQPQLTTTPEAAPAPPQPPPVREGDLVAAGTPGLVDPSLVGFKKVPYPPIAKMQRVSGTVVVSALVSESGRVIEARLVSGVSKNVGLNEAAIEMVRGATFRPATKDGVRVKAYKTVVVPFKL